MTKKLPKKFLLLLVAYSVIWSACSSGYVVPPTSRDENSSQGDTGALLPEEYEVISVILSEVSSNEPSPVVIFHRTTTYHLPFTNLAEALNSIKTRSTEGVSQLLLDDFAIKNADSATILDRLKIKGEYTLISPREIEEKSKEKGGDWAWFLREYPGRGLRVFSRAGFSPDMKQALVYSSTESGGKSGSGFYYLITKQGEKWKIIEKIESWRS